MEKRIIGIIGAIPQEVDSIIELLDEPQKSTLGKRDFYSGKIDQTDVTIVYSRIGKVAAATTVTQLIMDFNVTEILFIGVAGGIAPIVNIGDVVIADQLVQHDMDARPLMPRYEIPLLDITNLPVPLGMVEKAIKAAQKLVDEKSLHDYFDAEILNNFGIIKPKIHKGKIASGDLFFSKSAQKNNLLEKIPDVLCVEMEGAAVAQVCYEFDLPFAIIRTISDIADDSASVDFVSFIEHISKTYSREIIKQWLIL